MPDYNNSFYLRDFRLLHKSELLKARLKFQGFVAFVLNEEVKNTDFATAIPTAVNSEKVNYSSLVRTASLPEIRFKTEVKNQYNRKKIVSTGVEYTPVTIKLLDTSWNSSLDLIMRYYAYNYMNMRDFSNMSRADLKYMMSSEQENINSMFKKETFNSNLTGFNLNSSRYFFKRIDYVLYDGKKGVQYSLFNPVITELRTGDIDYSAAGEVLEFELTFDYENFAVYTGLNFELTETDLQRFETDDYANKMAVWGQTSEANLGMEGTTMSTDTNRTWQPSSKMGVSEVTSATASPEPQDTRAPAAQIPQ